MIGSGPNGLAAAIELQRHGILTMVIEQAAKPGGNVRTEEITLPGFLHDIGSSIHPLAAASPFFKTLPLEKYNLKWIEPDIPFAQPFEDGSACAGYRSLADTARQFPEDQSGYVSLFKSMSNDWEGIMPDILGPLHWPSHPVKFMKFGLKAIKSARHLAHEYFRNDKSRAFFYGVAAHGTIPLTNIASSSFGLVLFMLAHKTGWPFPEGGAERITSALVRYYESIGGTIETGHNVSDLREIPKARAYLFDLTPQQILSVHGIKFNWLYKQRLKNYRYGPGVFKVDYALSDPIPFQSEVCRKAGTIHFGFTPQEILKAEKIIHQGEIPEKPYILLAQHSVFDPTRAPAGKHTAWAYCHVPNGSTFNMTERIESQIEKAAPGFRDCILQRTTHNTYQLEIFNPNLVGGDINGGIQDFYQLFTRPVARLSPYSTPDPSVYICSSSTPPGGGVHGMCGYHSARKVMKDHFKDLKIKEIEH